MSTMDYPSSALLYPQTCTLTLAKAAAQFRSPFNGKRQSVGFLADSWQMSCTLSPKLRKNAGEVESFFMWLAGGENRVRCFHFARPVPKGSMRGTPTLAADAARGASTISIATYAGATLERGDLLGLGDQLLMVFAPAVANGSGVMTVNLTNRVRAAFGASSTVVWNKPTATFVMPGNFSAAHVPAVLQGAAFDLEEA